MLGAAMRLPSTSHAVTTRGNQIVIPARHFNLTHFLHQMMSSHALSSSLSAVAVPLRMLGALTQLMFKLRLRKRRTGQVTSA